MKKYIFSTCFLLFIIWGAQAQVDSLNIADSIPPRPVVYAKVLKATDIRHNRATLHGEIMEVDSNLRSFYFEYSVGGNTYQVKAVRNQDQLSANITDLVPESTYYFKVVAKTATGVQKTVRQSFRTLPKPITIQAHVTRHASSFSGWAQGVLNLNNLTGTKKRLVTACNYKNAVVRNRAATVAGQSSGPFNIGQICDIFDYCYNNWGYVNDPKSSDIYQYASSTLANGLNGDCDDFAIVTCSMLLAIGGDARISFGHTNAGGGHAFAEINCGHANMQKIADYIAARYSKSWSGSIHYKIDKNKNCWLNLDWWAKHPGGKYYQADSGTRFFILDNYCEDF